jgi:ABC-type Na+ efflux pump permease subunit
MKIDIKGFVFGSIIGVLIVTLCGVVFGVLGVIAINANGGLDKTLHDFNGSVVLLVSLQVFLFVAIGSFLSGLITAKISRSNQLLTSIAVGIVVAMLTFIPREKTSLVLTLISASFPVPFHYLGASCFLRSANKSQMEVTNSGESPFC